MIKNNTVWSHDGKKKLSRHYKTKAQAVKRLQQIEYFKHHKGKTVYSK